jgi:hypothetical protein
MGLGKTFQTIASLYCLLTKGINGQPTCKKPLILCPTSLVQVWRVASIENMIMAEHSSLQHALAISRCVWLTAAGFGIQFAANKHSR